MNRLAILLSLFVAPVSAADAPPRAFIDGTGPGWRALGAWPRPREQRA